MPEAALTDALARYLATAIGAEVRGVVPDEARRLPLAMRQRYQPWAASLHGQPCLFLIAADELEAPRIIAKHLTVAHNAWPGHIAVVAATLTPHLRRALLAARIPFVVPGTQLHLPFLGMLLSERFKAPRTTANAVRPATQAVLLWWIHHGLTAADTARELTRHVGYTAMSLSRVFDDLDRLTAAMPGLTITRIGRERKARWAGNAQELWTAARAHLRGPVLRRHLVCADVALPGLPAGLSGLARLSDLADPDTPVIATDHAAWLDLGRTRRLEPGLPGEPNTIEVEVWCHACDLHQTQQETRPVTADPLAIALTFTGTLEAQDERVEAALHQLVAEHAWRW